MACRYTARHFCVEFPSISFASFGHDNSKEGDKMKKKLFLLLSLFCIHTAGCSALLMPAETSNCRVVTDVSIHVDNATEAYVCHYSDSNKVEKTLYYLRKMKFWDHPNLDPASLDCVRYHITVRFSDGSKKRYEQSGYDYFRDSNGTWFEIPGELGIGLALLLAAVPSDAI